MEEVLEDVQINYLKYYKFAPIRLNKAQLDSAGMAMMAAKSLTRPWPRPYLCRGTPIVL